MKKFLLLVFIELLALPALFAQIHLSFTGKDVLGQHVRLHHVDIHNVTQDWTQTIYYPDTTLELTYVGIEDHNTSTAEPTGLSLSQNIPNPFDGSTRFSIHLPYNDDVNINIYDINGRLVLRDSRSLTAGNHVFRLTLGTAQSYVLSVRGSKERASIKMVNLSSKGNNRIEYESSTIDVELKVESGKGVMEYPFNEGDLMRFIGYVWLDTSFLASDTIEQYVTENEIIELIFRSWIAVAHPYSYVNDSILYIPHVDYCDGECFLYRTFNIQEFEPTDTIQNENDIEYLRLKMEHSYISDLWISLVCPNGQYATILRKGNNANNCQSNIPSTEIGWQGVAASQAYFGCYNSNNSNSACNPEYNPMGECWNYCWSNDTTQGYQYACGNSHVYELCNHITVNNPYGNSNDKYVDSSDVANMTNIYKPDDSFSKLIGCPLNGTWKIQIIDGNSGDNGYVEEAELVIGFKMDTSYLVLTIPEVSTNSMVFIASDSAVCYGQVIHDGNTAVTERGLCWDVNPNPDVNGPHAMGGAGTGTFSVTASSLTPGQTYYYRSYAINALGIAYGEERSFTTLDTACNSTLTDYDGNVYHMVRLGTQCWMKENLRTTHFPNGEEIPVYTDNMSAYPEKYRYAYGDIQVYGYHYNWHAAAYNVPATETSIIQGVCPNGWHLPSLAEWNTLRNYVESLSTYHCGDNVNYIAKALASATTDWRASGTACAPGNEVSTNDQTGFSARPAGVSSGTYSTGYGAFFWTSNNSTSDEVPTFPILYMWPDVSTTGIFNSMFKAYPLSVRCVRNLELAPPTVPSVATTNVNFITDSSAIVCGAVTEDGDLPILEQGICWGLTTPTISDSHIAASSVLDSFSCSLTNLSFATTYYARAYATNALGTGYGETVTFTTAIGLPTVALDSITDIGSSYATCHGTLLSDGGDSNTVVGLCWDLSPNPTNTSNHVEWNGTVGAFNQIIGGIHNAICYVRPYATNIAGTVYGNTLTFVPDTMSTSIRVSLVHLDHNFATIRVTIVCDSTTTITNRGLCMDTLPQPDLSDLDFSATGNVNIFDIHVGNLERGSIYYLRGHCVSNGALLYSNDFILLTVAEDGQACIGTPTMTDYEGHVYNTVQIGAQCWMRSNLYTTHFSDGTAIPTGDSGSGLYSKYEPYYYHLTYNTNLTPAYGYAYNWKALTNNSTTLNVNAQGICPDGWHVPDTTEWATLRDYTGAHYACGGNNASVAKALADVSRWNTSTENCSPGAYANNNNLTGFTAVPSGGHFENTFHVGQVAYFWSRTVFYTHNTTPYYSYALVYKISYDSQVLSRTSYYYDRAFPVRCLRDE